MSIHIRLEIHKRTGIEMPNIIDNILQVKLNFINILSANYTAVQRY
jgi:hypothetical protein